MLTMLAALGGHQQGQGDGRMQSLNPSQEPLLLVSAEGPISRITLHRPAKRNALSGALRVAQGG